MKARHYVSPGPEEETIMVHLPGQRPVVVPMAVAFALRYDLNKLLRSDLPDRTWWRVLVGRCERCTSLEGEHCSCHFRPRRHRNPARSRQSSLEWLRRERLAAVGAGRCSNCLKRPALPNRRHCGTCREKAQRYRARKKEERQSGQATDTAGFSGSSGNQPPGAVSQ